MATDIKLQSLKEPVAVADYLFRRLKSVALDAGATPASVFGVPGDYNLVALDYVEKNGLRWVGNCNELNAAYAADGYARVKGLSCIVTTFGVGELSALNGIAGAYSEFSPIVHIVGTPSTLSQKSGSLLHHTLGNGDFHVFSKMAAEVACAVERLSDPTMIPSQIDSAIQRCFIMSRPVYIALPTDMVDKKVEGELLRQPIDMAFTPNDPDKEDYVVAVLLKELHSAQRPVILVDACVDRHRAREETREFIVKSGIPSVVAPMGQSLIDDTVPNYRGVYAGDASHGDVRELVEGSDLVVSIGSIKSDFNTAGFSYRISQLTTIELHSTHVSIRYSQYPGVRMNGVLRKVSSKLSKPLVAPNSLVPRTPQTQRDLPGPSEILHAWLWPRLGTFFRPGDTVVVETGTSNFGIWETQLPEGVRLLNQILWGSIGWSVGAALGASLANSELEAGRILLFVGDGSLQLSVQELSTMLRHDLRPIVFIIANSGYTIERKIHGVDAVYNSIQAWNHTSLPAAFGSKEGQAKTYQVRTISEIEVLFKDEVFASASCLQIVELFMPKLDCPQALATTGERAARNNAEV